MRPLTPLCELARKHGTDKGGRHLLAGETCHEYTPIYWDLLNGQREDVLRVLEIGVNYGPSVRMWEDFFPNAEIVGLDSNAEALFHAGRIHCYAADQGREDSLLAALVAAGGHILDDKVHAQEFDLIVDDGSHEDHHQILSAQVLLPFLSADGVYVIEDLNVDCQPNKIAYPILEHMKKQGEEFLFDCFVCEPGMGKAMCGCDCGMPETLLVFRRYPGTER